jgi:hypothetical protein
METERISFWSTVMMSIQWAKNINGTKENIISTKDLLRWSKNRNARCHYSTQLAELLLYVRERRISFLTYRDFETSRVAIHK